MTGIFLGLGSNLGDRARSIRKAVAGLESRGIEVVRASHLYESEPVGLGGQPDFMNAVVEVETDLGPEELLKTCAAVENELGRLRKERWGARSIDIDLLLYDDRVLSGEELTIPHPRLTERRFVLEPLLEIAPDVRMPGGERLDKYIAGVSGQKVVRDDKLDQ